MKKKTNLLISSTSYYRSKNISHQNIICLYAYCLLIPIPTVFSGIFLHFPIYSRIVYCVYDGYICLSPNCVRIDEHEECLFSTQKIVFVDFCILFYFSWKKLHKNVVSLVAHGYTKYVLGYVPFVYCYIHLKLGITSVHLSRDRERCSIRFCSKCRIHRI